MRTCLPRTGLFTTAAPDSTAIRRVVPRATVLLIPVSEGMVLMNVFYYLPNELVILKWKTNMHHVTLGDGCKLVDIYAERLIPVLHDL